MPDPTASPLQSADRHLRRWPLWGAALVAFVAAVFLTLPALAGVPARLVDGCGGWIVAAGALELLSAVGFVVLFKLVFAAPISWRRSVPAALRALGATTVLPGGGLIGPAMGAWSTSNEKPALSRLTRATITFVILTNAPGAIVLAVVGVLLWLGLPDGPHQSTLTLLPAVLAVGLLMGTWLAGRSSRRRSPSSPGLASHARTTPVRAMGDGVSDARALITARDWKLIGAVAYYAFDNAVLWAAFHAFGRPPAVGVIIMGYLVGSLAGALPLPGGLGAVDGGLIGALVLYGAPAPSAAAAVLLYRGLSLGLPVVLGAIGWTCYSTRFRVRPHLTFRHRSAPEFIPTHERW
ncbi:MAG: putative heme transporter [Solirubrobacteraceae bacterium]|nr:putative heme transporter [Solirubrobacteraceae bacterium]